MLAIASTALAETVTLLDEGFEGYEYGDARNQGLTPFVAANASSFFCDITNVNAHTGSKCLQVRKIKGDKSQRGGAWLAIPNIEDYADKEGILTISYYEMLYSNMGGVGLGDGDTETDNYAGVFQTYWFVNGGTAHAKDVTNTKEFGEGYTQPWGWTPYVIKIRYPAGTIEEYSVNGTTFETILGYTVDTAKLTAICPGVFEPPYGANNRNGVAIDDIKVIFSDDPEITIGGAKGVIPFNGSDEDNTFVTTVYNSIGSVKVTAEVIEGRSWLKLDGSVVKTFTVNSQETVDLTATIDRYFLGQSCAKAVIRFTTETQTIDVEYLVQSGTRGAGYPFYASDFEDLEDNILDNLCWVASGTVNNCLVVDDPDDSNNRCLSIQTARALHTDVNMPQTTTATTPAAIDIKPDEDVNMPQTATDTTGEVPIYTLYDVKVSMRIKFPSTSNKSNISFGTNVSPADERQGEYRLTHTADGIKLNLDNCPTFTIDNYAPYDEWFTLSYSFNTNPENRTLKYVSFAGTDYTVNQPITLDAGQGTVGYFTQFRNYTWADTLYYIDDFKVELIKTGTVPEPALFGLVALLGLFLRRK